MHCFIEKVESIENIIQHCMHCSIENIESIENAIHRIPCSIESIDLELAGAVVSLFGACRKES